METSCGCQGPSYAKRHYLKAEQLSRGSKNLPPLQPGDHVAVQAQHGNNPKQWPHTGVVTEVGPHHSYYVSIDGSRTITKRNRQFLRKFTPFTPDIPRVPGPKPSITRSRQALAIPTLPVHTQPIPAQDRSSVAVPVDNSPKQNSNEQLLYQPEHDVPEDQPVQSVPEEPLVHHQPNSTLTLKVKKPAHLRERWIVAEPETVKPIRLQRDFDGNYKVMQSPTDTATMTPMMMVNPMSQFAMMSHSNNFPSNVTTPLVYNPLMNMQQDMAMMSPLMQQNDVANNSPHMLPNMMMPQQQYYQ